MAWLWGVLGLGILAFLWAVVGAFSAQGRLRAKDNELELTQKELDEWSGVYDVKREIDNRLNDESERKRLRDKYNKK